VATATRPSERPAASSLRMRSRPPPNLGERVADGLAADAVELVSGGAGGDQVAIVVASCGGEHAVGARRTDTAPGRLHGAAERLRIGRVREQGEVGERVFDLRALVQAEAAEHAVRDPGGGERGLHRRGRIAGAREHEHLAGWRAGRECLGDLAGDPGGLAAVVGERARLDATAGAAHRDQRLGGALRVVRDTGGRGADDLGARAEVAREHDLPVRRVAVAEAQDVAGLRGAEAVDRLVVVARAGDVAVGPGEQVQQRGLRLVGVLHLVDDQPAPARPQVREPVRMLGEQSDRADEQIVEGEGV
jgi:hypothetical protein